LITISDRIFQSLSVTIMIKFFDH